MEKLMDKWSKLMMKWSDADIRTRLKVMKDDRQYARKTGDSRWEKTLDEEIRKLKQKPKVKKLYCAYAGHKVPITECQKCPPKKKENCSSLPGG